VQNDQKCQKRQKRVSALFENSEIGKKCQNPDAKSAPYF